MTSEKASDAVLPQDEGKGQEYIDWGEEILITALFSIIICAPLGVALISAMGPFLLKKVTTHTHSHLHFNFCCACEGT